MTEPTMQVSEATTVLREEAGDAIAVLTMSPMAFWGESRPLDFRLLGTMGAAASIGLGIALGTPDRTVWVIDGDFRTPLRAAARAATLIGSACVVLARNSKKSTVLLWRDATLAMADSTVPRWRIYRIVPPTTPQSKFGGGEGLPSTRDIHPLVPAPEQVRALAEQAGVQLPLLLAALR